MSMSDYALEVEEQMYEDYALDQQGKEYLEALAYIEEFNAIVKNEEEYADLIEAKGKIVEYQEVYVRYEQDPSDHLKKEVERLGNTLDILSKHLKEQSKRIPISEKKLITVKEFEELYSIPSDTQSRYRNRFNDPLPYTQLTEKGTIYYNPKEVDKWMENYKIESG